MAGKSGEDKKLKLVTDPVEIRNVLGKQDSHERALREAGNKQREARTMAKIAAKMHSGKPFSITWNKIEGFQGVSSSLLTGNIMHSRDKEGEHFNLSVSVDYAKLYALNPDKQGVKPTTIEFNQHRATSFSAGSYDSPAGAKSALQRMDQYLMHVLAEQGAEKTSLALENGQVVISNSESASGQSYSDALHTARLVDIFRSCMIDAKEPDYKQVTGNLLHAILQATGLPFRREEAKENGQTTVRLVFERDIGEFTFRPMPLNVPAQIIHEIRTSHGPNTKKKQFEGPLTAELLQKQFVNWITDAARERGTISEETYEGLNGNRVTAIKGISLINSKLGLLSPFGEDMGFRGSGFTPN